MELAWTLGIASVAVALLVVGFQFVCNEYFPYWYLRQQKHAKPVPITKSYKGRTALVTGANGAYGSRAAKIFAHREVETLVLVDVRDCSALKEEIEAELDAKHASKPTILVWTLDMMSFAGAQELAKRAKSLKSLDHALMIMGILAFKRRESPEGWETSIQVNYLSTACIAMLLLPIVKAAESNPSPPVITFITSFGIFPAIPTMSVPSKGSYIRHLSNNKDGMAQAHQYGRSKGLLLYFARELSERITALKGVYNVTITSADPGPAWTGLTEPNSKMLIPRLITDLGARDPQIGATALVNGNSATADGHGKIFHDFNTVDYPPFMLRQSGHGAQDIVWKETRAELEGKVPEIRAVYAKLDG